MEIPLQLEAEPNADENQPGIILGKCPEGAALNTRTILVTLDTQRARNGWPEIDAVELVGRSGSRQWAARATASSSYAETLAPWVNAQPFERAKTLEEANERMDALNRRLRALEARIQELSLMRSDLPVERQTSPAKAPADPAPQPKMAPTSRSAQGIDPAQEAFVTAFLSARKAEEQAAAGKFQKALETFRAAADTLEKIKQQWPKWQPDLLEFRMKRTKEAISKMESQAAPAPAEGAKEKAAPEPAPAAAAEPAAPVKAPEPPPVPQPGVSTKENAFSTFSLNVSDVSFKLAAASLEKSTMPEPATVRSEEFINALNYRDPEPK
jgi:hypothetical protein